MSFEYWYLFPAGIVVATIAMASGVEGATFFTPLYLLILRLPADVAIGAGLITEVFGFSSGLLAYIRRGLIDFKLGIALLKVSIPVALLGTRLSKFLPPEILKLMLGIGLLAIAASFLIPSASKAVEAPENEHRTHLPTVEKTCIVNRKGQPFCYPVPNLTEGRLLVGIGSLFLGMLSTGLGELNGFFFIQRSQMPAPVSVATSVFVVAITALVASIGHVIQFLQTGDEALTTVLSIVMFSAPGVLIGAQFGSLVATTLSPELLERSIGILFAIVATFLLVEFAFNPQILPTATIPIADVNFSSRGLAMLYPNLE